MTLDILNHPPLKGATFIDRIAAICAEPLHVEPLPDLRYQRILIPGITGGEVSWCMMGLIGQALRQRGADVTALLCDSFLSGCVLRKVDHHESACTRWCHTNAEPLAAVMGMPHQWYSAFITEDERTTCRRTAAAIDRDELLSFAFRDIAYGTMIEQSVISVFKEGVLDLERPEMLAQARDFLDSAMCLTIIGHRVVDELAIEKVFTDSGQLVNWGVFREIARQRGIPVDVILESPRKRFMFECDRPPGGTRSMLGWDAWRETPLRPEQDARLDEHFRERELVPYSYRGERWTHRITETSEARRLVGLPEERRGRVFAMFPNVGFDAGRTKTEAAYEVASEWVVETVRFFADRPEHHLLIKVHPGERHREVRDPIVVILDEQVGALPKNVHFLEPTTPLTAHCIVRLADVCLVYTSTVAAEAAALGKPVVLTGGGWHAGRGITTDVHSPESYMHVLTEACAGRLPPAKAERGRRYAYALFFRANLPVNHFTWINDFDVMDVALTSVNDLMPGRDPAIDTICRGILYDEPFADPGA